MKIHHLRLSVNKLTIIFPDIYKETIELIPTNSPSTNTVRRGLAKYSIPADASRYHDYPIAEALGDYMYDRIGFDDYEYELTVKGAVKSLTGSGREILSDTYDQPIKYRGYICAIRLEIIDNEEPVYRPSYVVAEPSHDTHGAFHACIIPAEQVTKLRNLRSRVNKFGRYMLKSFDTPDDIAEYMRKQFESERTEEEALLETHNEAGRLIDDAFNTEPNQSVNQCYHELPLDNDMATIMQQFRDILCEAIAIDPTREPTEGDYAAMYMLLRGTIQQLETLAPRDVIATKSDAVIVLNEGVGDIQLLRLHDDESITGRFEKFVLIKTPEMKRLPQEMSEFAPEYEVNIGIVMCHCKVYKNNEEVATSEALDPTCTVVLSPHIPTRFVKLDFVD